MGIFRARYNYEVIQKRLLRRAHLVGVDTIDSLLAEDIESATEVSSPAITQVHALTSSDTQSTSEVSSPALTQVHGLTSTDVESAAEVSAPTLTQNAPDLGPNRVYLWKGAVQPNDLGEASGNEVVMAKGAVQPSRSYEAPAVADTAKGGRVRKKKRRYFVEVDGVLIEATSQDEATQILLQARELAKEQAPKLAEPGKNIPQIKVLTRTKQTARAKKIVDAVEEANRQIKRIYRDAQKSLDASRAVTTEAAQREIARQKRREERERDEQDAITLILLS